MPHFKQLTPWAILPEKPDIDQRSIRTEAALYESNFRYLRFGRKRELCPPWIVGQRIGWQVSCPVPVTLHPLDDVQFSVPPAESPETVGRKHDVNELWDRGGAWVGTRNGSWLQRYDYMHAEQWTSMFTPNGEGTVEWRLGWSCEINDDQLLVVLTEEKSTLTVPFGVLTSKQLEAMNSRGGISIPVRIDMTRTVTRGEPIARIAVVPKGILNLDATYESFAK